jgi:hypothetical protein
MEESMLKTPFPRTIGYVGLAFALSASDLACGSGDASTTRGHGTPTGSGSAATSGTAGSGGTIDPPASGSGGSGGSSVISVPDGGRADSGLEGCAMGEAKAARLPVYLLFVLDGSGSMSHDNKWVAATGAIDAIFTDMAQKGDPGVGAGLIVYSDSTDPNLNVDGDYPTSRDVPIGFVDQPQLAKLVARTAPPVQPQSNTPTGRALTGGYAELSKLQPVAPLLSDGKKVLVLLTDGIPTDRDCKTVNKDGTDDYTQNFCVRMAATELAKAGPEGPIQTFVIGTGPLPGDFMTYDPYFLGALAVAGGSAPMGCNPKANAAGGTNTCYFNVDPTGATATATQQAFLAAINDIRGQVSSCTLSITPTPGAGPIDPTKVNVVLNGTTVPQNPADGWTYDDPRSPTSVTLHGTSCDALKSDPNAKISIVLGCAVVTR